MLKEYNFNYQLLKSLDNVKYSQRTYQIKIKSFVESDENNKAQKQNFYYNDNAF